MIRACVYIAFRHLVTRRRQSLLTILGLSIGVMVLISSVSMMDGLRVSFIMQMLQVSPHVTVKPDPVVPEPMSLIDRDPAVLSLHLPEAPDEEDEIRNYRAVEKAIEDIPGVIVAAPELMIEGFLVYGSVKKSAQVHGVVPARQQAIGNLADRVVDGTYASFQAAPDGAVMGYRLAQRLTIGVGDHFQAVGKTGGLMTLRLCALMKTGVSSFDGSHVLIHLDRAQILAGTASDRVTNINIRVMDPDRAKAVALAIEDKTGRAAETWKETHENVLSLYTMMGRISIFLVIFTALAAGLGVSNLLTTVVLEKSRDIAVLMSMGYTRPAVSLVFLIEGVALGTAGALLGCLLGYLNTRFLGALPFEFGEEAIITRRGLYMNQDYLYYLLSAGFGFMVSLVAGVAPARRASRLDPVEIMRAEV